MSLPNEKEPRKRLSRSESGEKCVLSVPSIDAEASLLNAALAYAAAGWYVFPVRHGSKAPAVGNWDENSTREPEQIRRWWQKNPDYNIALHAGRSGAIIFDADIDDLAVIEHDGRPDLANALRAAGAIQSTRRKGERGHYLFALATGEMFGNGAGAFIRYGQVRGRNGYIVVAPSAHPDAETKGGRYNWRKTGALSGLPGALRACLSETGGSTDPLTDAEFEAFLDNYPGMGCGRDDCRKAVAGPYTQFKEQVAEGGSRHDAMRDALPWAFSEAMAGCYSAREAFGTLSSAFAEAKPEATGGEFYRLAQWAAANAHPTRAHRNDGGPNEDELAAFWSARPELTRLQQFARARLTGPWSTLGAVLARVIATIPPHVVLPPTVGSVASVNLYVALVAPSGFGKGASEAVAEDFLITEGTPFVATLGSGEGLLKQYAYKKKTEQINLRDAVVFTVPEVDTVAALSGRGGSTLMPELRKAWMGERLGFGWADVEKAVAIMAHRYRMTMIVGVQPGRGGVLLDDTDGGTPQRFLWLPTTDPGAPDEPPEEPDGLRISAWPSPADQTETVLSDEGSGLRVKFDVEDYYRLEEPADRAAFHKLALPPSVVDAIHAEHLAKRRGEVTEGSALDSHAMLARLKVAVGLMWMNGRADKISEEDWTLAGTVMAVSNATRAGVQTALRSNKTKVAEARGRHDAEREVVKEDVLRDRNIARISERIREKLRDENHQAVNALKHRFSAADREFVWPALEFLQKVGHIDVEEIIYRGRPGHVAHFREGR